MNIATIKKLAWAAVTILLLPASTVPVGAVPLTATESTDFSGNLSFPTMLGTLDVGTNTVSGSLANTIFSANLDVDVFSVVLPTNLIISSLSIDISGLSLNDGSGGRAEVINSGTGFVNFSADGTYSLAPFTITSSPVEFRIFPLGACGLFYSNTCSEFGYTLNLDVVSAQVPEPGALALFATGLVGLGLTRRRRMKKVTA